MFVSLSKDYNLITKLSYEILASHLGDTHKIEFLCRATIGYDWSQDPLIRAATHVLTFQILHGELEAALRSKGSEYSEFQG